MFVSVVILSFNSARHLETCVRSVARALAEHAAASEILVFENGSTDGSVDLLRQLEREYSGVVKGIYCNHNKGTTSSRNIALEQATGRYVLVVDSDVEVPLGILGHLISQIEGDPSCGIAAPRLVYPDGRPHMSTDTFPTVGRKLRRLWTLNRMEQEAGEITPASDAVSVDYAASAFWLLRRDILERVGYFDEKIFYSPEDVDYCIRVWAAGYRVVYVPSVCAIHDARRLSRRWRYPLHMLSHLAGLVYLFRKHRYAFSRRALYRRLGRGIESSERQVART